MSLLLGESRMYVKLKAIVLTVRTSVGCAQNIGLATSSIVQHSFRTGAKTLLAHDGGSEMIWTGLLFRQVTSCKIPRIIIG